MDEEVPSEVSSYILLGLYGFIGIAVSIIVIVGVRNHIKRTKENPQTKKPNRLTTWWRSRMNKTPPQTEIYPLQSITSLTSSSPTLVPETGGAPAPPTAVVTPTLTRTDSQSPTLIPTNTTTSTLTTPAPSFAPIRTSSSSSSSHYWESEDPFASRYDPVANNYSFPYGYGSVNTGGVPSCYGVNERGEVGYGR